MPRKKVKPTVSLRLAGVSVVQNVINPLLVEDILEKVMSYSIGHPNTSMSCHCQLRLVNKAWNNVISRQMKKSCTILLSSLQKVLEFSDLMSDSFNPPYQKILFKLDKESKYIPKRILTTFFETVGQSVRNIGLESQNVSNIFDTLMTSVSLMPNIEDLQLFKVNGKILHYVIASGSLSFPRLKSFTLLKGYHLNVSDLFYNIIKKCPRLEHLNIEFTGRLFTVINNLHRTNLVSLKVAFFFAKASDPYPHYINYASSNDVSTLINACPSIRKLDIQVLSGHFTDPSTINEWLSTLSVRELLQLRIEFNERFVEPRFDEYSTLELLLPTMINLKELDICLAWYIVSLDFLLGLPNLNSFKMDFNLCMRLTMTKLKTSRLLHHQHENLSVLKLEPGSMDFDMDMDSTTVYTLGKAFPRLAELHICVQGNEAVRSIFSTMPKLKKLILQHSPCLRVTDEGITGITLKDLYSHIATPTTDCTKLRKYPFIGDLKDLQYFDFKRLTLTNASVFFGFTELTELTTLKIMPHIKPLDESSTAGDAEVEPIMLKPLADNLKALVNIEIYNPENCVPYWWKDVELPVLTKKNVVTDKDIVYIKEKLPYLQLLIHPYLNEPRTF